MEIYVSTGIYRTHRHNDENNLASISTSYYDISKQADYQSNYGFIRLLVSWQQMKAEKNVGKLNHWSWHQHFPLPFLWHFSLPTVLLLLFPPLTAISL
jgi:hypothetical protein